PGQPGQAGLAQAQPAQPQPAPAGAGPAPAVDASQPAAAAAPTGAAPAAEQTPPPPPPPAELAGAWKAQPAPDVTITLTLAADGAFTWTLSQKGKTESLQGQAGFQDNVLALNQEQGPPLVGKVTRDGGDKFTFKPSGAPDSVKGLEFTRENK